MTLADKGVPELPGVEVLQLPGAVAALSCTQESQAQDPAEHRSRSPSAPAWAREGEEWRRGW